MLMTHRQAAEEMASNGTVIDHPIRPSNETLELLYSFKHQMYLIFDEVTDELWDEGFLSIDSEYNRKLKPYDYPFFIVNRNIYNDMLSMEKFDVSRLLSVESQAIIIENLTMSNFYNKWL